MSSTFRFRRKLAYLLRNLAERIDPPKCDYHSMVEKLGGEFLLTDQPRVKHRTITKP